MAEKPKRKLKHHPYLKLKELLVGRGLKQKYLADLLGLSVVTINQKINGTLNFTYEEVEIFCDDLNVSTEILRGQIVA